MALKAGHAPGINATRPAARVPASHAAARQGRYQFYRGTVTRALCTRCATGYRVASNGRACWCAPGFYLSGALCPRCGGGAYCPGSRSTAASAVRFTCGTNLQTTTGAARCSLVAPEHTVPAVLANAPCCTSTRHTCGTSVASIAAGGGDARAASARRALQCLPTAGRHCAACHSVRARHPLPLVPPPCPHARMPPL